jgi:uncharacterized protein YbbC (DUF1343 family)
VLREAARFGLLANHASVNNNFEYAATLLARRFPRRLAALFSPQHGFWGEQPESMIETGHGRDEVLGVPEMARQELSTSPPGANRSARTCSKAINDGLLIISPRQLQSV